MMEPQEVHINVSKSQDAVIESDIEVTFFERFAVVRQHFKRMKTQIARKFTKNENEFDLLKNIKFINDRLDKENKVVDEWKKAIKINLVKVSDVKKQQIAVDEYKERVIDRLCDVNDNMKELYFIAEDELKIINMKLKQKWRLFGRKGLRNAGLKLNGLLNKTSDISDNIVAQIEPLESKMEFNSK